MKSPADRANHSIINQSSSVYLYMKLILYRTWPRFPTHPLLYRLWQEQWLKSDLENIWLDFKVNTKVSDLLALPPGGCLFGLCGTDAPRSSAELVGCLSSPGVGATKQWDPNPARGSICAGRHSLLSGTPTLAAGRWPSGDRSQTEKQKID